MASVVTVAVLVILPACRGLTTMSTVAEAPLARTPRSQFSFSPVVPQNPWLGAAETNVTL